MKKDKPYSSIHITTDMEPVHPKYKLATNKRTMAHESGAVTRTYHGKTEDVNKYLAHHMSKNEDKKLDYSSRHYEKPKLNEHGHPHSHDPYYSDQKKNK